MLSQLHLAEAPQSISQDPKKPKEIILPMDKEIPKNISAKNSYFGEPTGA
jgi:hypothetical protein